MDNRFNWAHSDHVIVSTDFKMSLGFPEKMKGPDDVVAVIMPVYFLILEQRERKQTGLFVQQIVSGHMQPPLQQASLSVSRADTDMFVESTRLSKHLCDPKWWLPAAPSGCH